VTEEGVRIPQPGETVAGKYRLLRLLGEGGMGMVLAAEHLRLRQPIAIKFLNPKMLGVAEIVERFDREARAAATLRSRHVVRVTDVEQTPEGVPYMVMELLEGADLESERERRAKLPWSEAVDYVLQACGALTEAHDAGIVHRDLKPGNLFLAKEEVDRVIVKVLDFGISKFLKGEDAKLTSAGAIMGTALYMSPEQIRGESTIDARSDIWSLGVILYELISGDAPWMGPPTRVAAGIVSEPAPELGARCEIPEALAKTIHSMLEKRAADRPQSVLDVVFAIAQFAPQGSVGAEVAEQLARRSQRNLGGVVRPPTSRPSISLGAPVSSPVPSSTPAPSSSERFQLVISTRANPERSTMAATTTSTSVMARPRALWGALAGFGTLAIAGVALIVFVTKSKPQQLTVTAPPDPPSSSILSSPVPKAAEPALTASTEPSATPSAAPATSASARPVVAATASSSRKPPSTSTSAATVAAHPSATTPTARPKPPETAPAINPPFLK
jgi:eukaryotic-like serine/threonine-protein kinase